jgi:alkanesulfonate monooxygenase SsuD/methylene tetrahydromethanopterin reductase-like flavin-dependent oxidoreductase (luciferase family)
VVEHHGEFFEFGPVMFEPKPTHAPWPSLHIGGDGPAALRRAATVGDGWIPMNHTLDEIPADAKRIAQLRIDAGRSDTVEITLGGGSDLDDLRRRADLGVGRALVRPWRSSKDAIESIRRFSEEVLPEIRDYPVTAPTP